MFAEIDSKYDKIWFKFIIKYAINESFKKNIRLLSSIT